MYVVPTAETLLQQGDIFTEFPFVTVNEETDQVLLEEEGVLSLRDFNIDIDREGFRLAVTGNVNMFMAVSQTCDLQAERRSHVSIAPIYPITVAGGNDKQESVRRHKVIHQLYLYPTEHFEESFVDFSQITCIPRTRLDINTRLISLDLKSQHYLSDRLKQVYGRPVEPPKPDFLQ